MNVKNAPGRILVTGASGQLGSYVLRELRARNWPAVAWSMRPNTELFGYPCQSVDLRDTDQVIDAFRVANPDYVIHAAAMSSALSASSSSAETKNGRSRIVWIRSSTKTALLRVSKSLWLME